MLREARPLTAVRASVDELIAKKLRYLVPMAIIFIVGYIGLTVLAGFAKGVLALKVVGGFNLGFLLIACNYVLSWMLAIVYARIANTVFDPRARELATAMAGAGASA